MKDGEEEEEAAATRRAQHGGTNEKSLHQEDVPLVKAPETLQVETRWSTDSPKDPG